MLYKAQTSLTYLLGLALLPVASFAADFTVDTTVDGVDVNPGDGQCLTSRGDCSLRAAVMETNALSGADTITVPANSYRLFIAGAGEDQAAEGDLDILDDLTVVGESADTTIITGNFNASRVFQVLKRSDNRLPVVTFKKLTLRQGAGEGAVLYNDGIVTMDDVTVSDASPDSSAIRNTYELTILNSRIVNNFKGVVSSVDSSGQSRTLTVRDSLFENNIGGRALYSDAVYTEISGTTFRSNTRADGGGGAVFLSKGVITIDNSDFDGNSAADGGAIYSSGFLTITNSSFSNNKTFDGSFRDAGGALYATGHTDVVDTIFSGNVATGVRQSYGNDPGGYGGAIYCDDCVLNLQRVTLSGNSVDADGGGLYQYQGRLSISDSIVSNN